MNQPDSNQVALGIAEFLRTETNFHDPSLIHERTRLLELGILDSLAIMSLVAFCEKAYGCQIEPNDLTEEFLESPLALATLVVRLASRLPERSG